MKPALPVCILALAVLLLFAGPSVAAGLDCARPQDPLEKTVCANPDLSRLHGDVIRLFTEKETVFFDRAGLRAQWADWWRVLRESCAKTCLLQDVEAAYKTQHEYLKMLTDETFSANYKTGDIAVLDIQHIDQRTFGFKMRREGIDDATLLCALPAKETGPFPVARLVDGDSTASWEDGGCRVDFTMERDDAGSVARIVLVAGDGCASFCPAAGHTLSDTYTPDNVWVAGNQ